MSRHHEERGTGAARAFDPHHSFEAPVRIGAAQAVDGDARKCARFPQRRATTACERVRLEPGGRPAHADRRPAPGCVDIVSERDGEARTSPARRLYPEASPQPFQRGIEWVEARSGGCEPPVPVAGPGSLLDAREVEERVGDLVVLRALAAFDLLPRLRPVWKVDAELEIARAERVEHPTRATLDCRGCSHEPNAPITYRTTLTRPGLGSSTAKTPSTYGGRRSAGDCPCMTLIDQRLEHPFVCFGGRRSPTRSQ